MIDISTLNPAQLEAVTAPDGPVLVIAGAGSGKTRTIVHRLAWLAEQGVPASDMLLLTFTRKASREMLLRATDLLGYSIGGVHGGTFHSFAFSVLRQYRPAWAEGPVTVMDSTDSASAIQQCKERLKVGKGDRSFPKTQTIIGLLSKARNKEISIGDVLQRDAQHLLPHADALESIGEAYRGYRRQHGLLDYDDLLFELEDLLKGDPEAGREGLAERFRERYRYIMVDEYQDTNNSQFLLVSLLAGGHQNICVVGDDDQSIYKFRGATIENILNFENQYRDTKVIRLEQNYRCTQTILDAANAVIENNTQRKGKTLWTQNPKGTPVKVYRALNEQDEARFIADTILDNVAKGQKFADHAILYRMNAQSNTIENALIRSGIAYRIIGGQRFYDRKEIKDIIAYMSVIDNHSDSVRLRRIINEPKRGIGDATVDKAQEIADMLGLPLFEVLAHADEYQPLAKRSHQLMEFAQMIERLGEIADGGNLEELFDELLAETGYMIYLQSLGEEGVTRIENVGELKTNILKYIEETEKIPQPSIDPDNPDEQPEIVLPTLSGFLEEVTLYTDLDNYDENADRVIMMTMHSAKGLEFNNVFFCGAEEGIFPGVQAIYNPDQIEEERRLAYVCITRAKKQLYITNAAQRMIFGQTVRNRVSRFVTEIPASCCDVEDKTVRKASAAELKRANTVKKTHADNAIGVGGLRQKTTSYSSDAPTGAACTLKAGDRVSHKTFGEGSIVKVTPMGGDCLLEVLFDTVGTKKIMYKFAKLTKLS